MDIVTGISAASEALKIVKTLKDVENSLDNAEFKLRVVGLIDHLLEAKEALQDAKERERKLSKQIYDLKEQLRDQQRHEDDQGMLFELDADGDRSGEPFCNKCYVDSNKQKKFRLIRKAGDRPYYQCPKCNCIADIEPYTW